MGAAIISPSGGYFAPYWRGSRGSANAFRGRSKTGPPLADQREQPAPAEQQQDGKAVDEKAGHDQQQQRHLVAKGGHWREIYRGKRRGKPKTSGNTNTP